MALGPTSRNCMRARVDLKPCASRSALRACHSLSSRRSSSLSAHSCSSFSWRVSSSSVQSAARRDCSLASVVPSPAPPPICSRRSATASLSSDILRACSCASCRSCASSSRATSERHADCSSCSRKKSRWSCSRMPPTETCSTRGEAPPEASVPATEVPHFSGRRRSTSNGPPDGSAPAASSHEGRTRTGRTGSGCRRSTPAPSASALEPGAKASRASSV
mmetsp:Transcript_3076/g.10294  ORF Transcript_3076/g.10294 Transcript_3076/m.10294 type:complete len:220 (+) Transcript_3076:3090-3749(+)